MKIQKIANCENGGFPEYVFLCPACKCCHGFRTVGGHPQWTYNGNADKPTISPSILVTGGDKDGKTICHSFVTDGKIQFLSDCTHAMAGQTVEMSNI